MGFLSSMFGISPSNVPVKYSELRNKMNLVKTEKERGELIGEFEWLKRRIIALQRRKSIPDPKIGRMLGGHLSYCDAAIRQLEGAGFKRGLSQRQRKALEDIRERTRRQEAAKLAQRGRMKRTALQPKQMAQMQKRVAEQQRKKAA